MKKSDVVLASVATVLLASVALAEVTNPVVPHTVFHAAWSNSLSAASSNLVFQRPSEATWFDIKAQQIVTVPADTPRFVSTLKEGKRWGALSGLLLEGGTSNLLTDSSFEAAETSGAWQLTGKVEKQGNVGVHGQYGLHVRGPATIEHVPVKVRVCSHPCTYILSLYVRRKDGAAVGPDAVRCFGHPSDNGAWWSDNSQSVTQLPPERMGDGPWHRVSARIGYHCEQKPTTDLLVYGFSFDGNEYYVDAAQLEPAGGNQNVLMLYSSPSTYVPTTTQPAARSAETMSAPAQDVLPGTAWSYAVWTYADYPGAQGRIFGMWGDGLNQWMYLHRNGVTGSGWPGAAADKAPATGWVYLTVTYDGTKMDFFVNGVSDHTEHGPFPVKLPAPLPGKAYWARDFNLFPGWGGEMLAPCGPIADFTTWDRALTPEEVNGLYATGEPCVLDTRRPGDVPVTFDLKKPGKVSLNIYYPDGRLAHQLLIGKSLPAGKHTVYWDGCDDAGKPVAKGKYRIKGLCSNVHSVWDAKMGNSSPSQGNEWLQYRTGTYCDVAPRPGGGVVTLSNWGEHGKVIQGLDDSPDYPVAWSVNGPSSWAVAAAADETYVYTVFLHRLFDGKMDRESITRWRLTDGAGIPYGPPGERISERGELWITPPRTPAASPTIPQASYAGVGVCGLAAHNGKLYAPCALEDRILVLDAGSGRELQSIPCPKPRKVAADDQFLYVTCGKTVERINLADGTRTTLIDGLSDACAIAVGPQKTIYLTDLGGSQQVKVFQMRSAERGMRNEKSAELTQSAGTNSIYELTRVFGRTGGHRGGAIAPDLLESPIGLAIGTDGTLFIADLGGRRALALTSEFALKKEFYGDMSGTVAWNKHEPDCIYQGGLDSYLYEYAVDYTKKTEKMIRRWHGYGPELMGWPMNEYSGPPCFRKWGKRTFIIYAGTLAIAELDGDRIIPRVMLGQGKQIPGMLIRDASWTPEQVTDNKGWIWRDKNADGKMQASEFEFGDWPLARTRGGWHQSSFMDEQGNLYYTNQQGPADLPRGVVKFPFEGLDSNGLPIYRWESAHFVLTMPKDLTFPGKDGKMYPVFPNAVVVDREGCIYITDHGDMGSNWNIPLGLLKFGEDGALLWRVGRTQPGAVWHPGDISSASPLDGFVDGRYIFVTDYVGEMNIWDTDGLWVAKLFSDLPDNLFLPGETFGGCAYRHPNGNVYAITAPDCIYRMARIVVAGLDDIERFDGKVKVTTVAEPRVIVAEQSVWRIERRTEPIRIDGEINARGWNTDTSGQAPESFVYNDQEVAKSWAQWDDEALYLAWRIRDDTPAVTRQVGSERWAADQVEFMIRAALGDASHGCNAHTAQEYQLAIGPDKDGKVAAFVLINGSDKKGNFLTGAEAALQIMPDKQGYTMEARIPWASLGDYRPAKGDHIRWNMIIDFGTSDGTSLHHGVKWTTGWHVDPSTWGEAVFE